MKVSTATQTCSVTEAVSQTTPNEQKNVDNKASTAFQSQTLSEKIEKSWEAIPFLMALEKEKQEQFSQIIAYEIQDLLKNGQVCTQVHYDKKMIYDFTSEKSDQSPFTFYISIKPEKDKAVVSINENKITGLMGRGTHKEVYSGIKIHIPLETKEKGKAIKIFGSAISHPVSRSATPFPTNTKQFDGKLVNSLEVHKKLYSLMKKHNLPGRLTKPPKLREHIQKSTGCKKQELIQPLYQSDMSKVMKNDFCISEKGEKKFVSIHERLDLIVEFLDSVASIHDLGWVHRDVKPNNILINREEGDLHSYLHDFDLTCYEPVSDQILTKNTPVFWDELGKWLVSISSDFIGCMLTAIDVLYGTVDYDDVSHQNYKKGIDHAFYWTMGEEIFEFLKDHSLPSPRVYRKPEKFIKFLDKLSNNPAYSLRLKCCIRLFKIEAELCLKLMKLFCSYFQKESKWKKQMIGSAITYYIQLGMRIKKDLDENSAEDVSRQLKDLFIEGVHHEFRAKLIENLPVGCSEDICAEHDFYEFFDKLSAFYEPISQEDSSVLLAEKVKFYQLASQIYNLESFLLIPPKQIPKTAKPLLFALLNSKKLEDRLKGRQLEYERFGRVSDLSQKIREFAKEFKEASEKTAKEFGENTSVRMFLK